MKYLSSGCHMLTTFCPQPQKPAETHLTASRMWASLVQKCGQDTTNEGSHWRPVETLQDSRRRLVWGTHPRYADLSHWLGVLKSMSIQHWGASSLGLSKQLILMKKTELHHDFQNVSLTSTGSTGQRLQEILLSVFSGYIYMDRCRRVWK